MLDVIVAARILALSRAGRDEAGAATPASHWLAEQGLSPRPTAFPFTRADSFLITPEN